MARTTSELVMGVLLRDYDNINNPSLTPFIDTASMVVSRVVTCASDKEEPLTAAEAEMVERWLAAHFYAVSDKPYASKSTEGASASFQGQTAMRLEFTGYGQTAMGIDPSGCLEAMNKRQTASASWLGKRPSEQIDFVDRD